MFHTPINAAHEFHMKSQVVWKEDRRYQYMINKFVNIERQTFAKKKKRIINGKLKMSSMVPKNWDRIHRPWNVVLIEIYKLSIQVLLWYWYKLMESYNHLICPIILGQFVLMSISMYSWTLDGVDQEKKSTYSLYWFSVSQLLFCVCQFLLSSRIIPL